MSDAPNTTILQTLMEGEFSEATAARKRPRSAMEPPVEYRSKQFTAIPDVGASVRKWSLEDANQQRPAPELVEAFLRHVLEPRVSIFTLLATPELGQRFSLDNGLVLQSLVTHWLQHYRIPKRVHGKEAEMLVSLKRERQARAVWWEARVVKIWTWPAEDAAALIGLCRTVLEAALAPEAGSTICTTTHGRNISGTGDICASCTAKMLADLSADYKCVLLVRCEP